MLLVGQNRPPTERTQHLAPYPCQARCVLSYVESQAATLDFKAELASWLQSFHWDQFITVTFREPRQPHTAQATLRQVERVVRQTRYGRLFLGTELHINRTLHVHGLLQGPGTVVRFPGLPDALWRDLYRRFGRSQVQWVRSKEAVSNYCTKYVTKELTEWYIW